MMEPEVVDAAIKDSIVRSNIALKDSSFSSPSQKPKPKPEPLEEDPTSLRTPEALVRKREKTNLDPKLTSDNQHTPEEDTVSDPLVKRPEHLEDPHGMILRRLRFESDRIDKCDAEQGSEEEEEEPRSDNESLLESVLSENGTESAQAADELLIIGFSAVSIADDDEDELCPAAAAYDDDIHDDAVHDLLLLIPDDEDEAGSETPIATMPWTGKVCPLAPIKPPAKRRNFKKWVDSSICRKLQF